MYFCTKKEASKLSTCCMQAGEKEEVGGLEGDDTSANSRELGDDPQFAKQKLRGLERRLAASQSALHDIRLRELDTRQEFVKTNSWRELDTHVSSHERELAYPLHPHDARSGGRGAEEFPGRELEVGAGREIDPQRSGAAAEVEFAPKQQQRPPPRTFSSPEKKRENKAGGGAAGDDARRAAEGGERHELGETRVRELEESLELSSSNDESTQNSSSRSWAFPTYDAPGSPSFSDTLSLSASQGGAGPLPAATNKKALQMQADKARYSEHADLRYTAGSRPRSSTTSEELDSILFAVYLRSARLST